MQNQTAPASSEAIIRAWARTEVLHWRRNRVSYEDSLRQFASLNETMASVFLFKFADGGVELLSKPEALRHAALVDRAEVYRRFFAEVVEQAPLAETLVLALGVGDAPVHSPRAPTFSFQKLVGDQTILINDPNMMEGSFYEPEAFLDTCGFAQKDRKAIFIGATSGMHNSPESVRARKNQRIDAALYFKDVATVDFFLPNIVQCEPEAAALIRAMDIGSSYLSWPQQFNYKFLLSLDGNGAACQRIAVALKSNCSVLKYNSNSILYYFKGLTPWFHYIPISTHAEVAKIIEHSADEDDLYAEIAMNGRDFYSRFLSRQSQYLYFRNLLAEYARAFK